jgi:hypothetical protein
MSGTIAPLAWSIGPSACGISSASQICIADAPLATPTDAKTAQEERSALPSPEMRRTAAGLTDEETRRRKHRED